MGGGLIAAIDVANALTVWTCKPDDFIGIDRLEVVPVDVPLREQDMLHTARPPQAD